MQHAIEHDPLVTDYRKALMLASELRSVGAHEDAQVWAQLADFLMRSEIYIFDKIAHAPVAQWTRPPHQLEQ